MSKERQVILKEADITNNCPKCYSQDMQITFFQKHTFGKLYHRTTNEVTHEIKCRKCGSVIYPIDWTDDIERIFDYYQKMVVPERPSIRFTSLFFIVVLLLVALVSAGIYFVLTGIIQF